MSKNHYEGAKIKYALCNKLLHMAALVLFSDLTTNTRLQNGFPSNIVNLISICFQGQTIMDYWDGLFN